MAEKKKSIILRGVFLICALSYISLIFNNNLWVDEAFTASIIRGNLKEVWEKTAADTLPPFYNFFTKFLTIIFGYSAPVMKFSSILPMILTLLLSVTRVKKLFGFRTSLIFTLSLAAMPHFFYYGVEIRMYSWGIFFLTLTAVSALEGKWVLFAVSTALCGYTHHFALVSASFLWLFMLIRIIISLKGGKRITSKADTLQEPSSVPEPEALDSEVPSDYTVEIQNENSGSTETLKIGLFDPRRALRSFFLSLLLFMVLYAPCFTLALSQIRKASSYFSMTPLTFSTFLSDLRFPFVTEFTLLSALLLLMTLFSIINAFFICFRGERLTWNSSGLIIDSCKPASFCSRLLTALSLIAVLPLTVFFGYGVSALAKSSLFTARYLVPSLGPFWLGVSILMGMTETTEKGDREPFPVSFSGLGLTLKENPLSDTSPSKEPETNARVRISAPLLISLEKAFFIISLVLIIVVGIHSYKEQFKQEYTKGVEEMTAFFDENLGPDDGYIIYEDNYQIEICFRYYYPSLKKYDWDTVNEIKGNIWYFEVEGYKKELEKSSDYGYNSVYICEMSFDRYSFRLYKLIKTSP